MIWQFFWMASLSEFLALSSSTWMKSSCRHGCDQRFWNDTCNQYVVSKNEFQMHTLSLMNNHDFAFQPASRPSAMAPMHPPTTSHPYFGGKMAAAHIERRPSQVPSLNMWIKRKTSCAKGLSSWLNLNANINTIKWERWILPRYTYYICVGVAFQKIPHKHCIKLSVVFLFDLWIPMHTWILTMKLRILTSNK